MRELRTEIEIQAPAPQVWAILTDFQAYPEWNPFIPEAKGEVVDGALLQVRIKPPRGKAMLFKPTVIEVNPDQGFRWLGRLLIPGLFDGEHIFEIESLEEGCVRFIHREQFRGVLIPFMWNNLNTNVRKGFEAMNVALKQRAEVTALATSYNAIPNF